MTSPTARPSIPTWDLWSRTWRRLHRVRRRWYSTRSRSLPVPVVSIGNLHWGGTGKTPIVDRLARQLTAEGRTVAILSRGYGRQSRGPVLVSRGRGPLVSVEESGDEPFAYATDLPNVGVVVAESRWQGGRLALRELDPTPDLFLLDDGFSHLALGRDLDLLVVPASDPFGGGRLPPAGRLREPLDSAARADALLLTGAPIPADLGGRVLTEYRDLGFAGPLFTCHSRTELPTDATENDEPWLLVTGIARGHRVLDSAREHGLGIAEHLEFPDHHGFPDASLRRIHRRLEATEARGVLTTAKDRAKLESRLDLEIAVLALHVELDAELVPWILARLGPLETDT